MRGGVHGVILSQRQNAVCDRTAVPVLRCDRWRRCRCATVLDDDVAIAFLDRSPVFKGHVLVVPEASHRDAWPTSTPISSARCSNVCSESSARMPAALGCDGTFVAINNVVSQSVAHLHVHVVPRRRKDGLRGFFWPRVKYESDAEADDYARRLSEALAD